MLCHAGYFNLKPYKSNTIAQPEGWAIVFMKRFNDIKLLNRNHMFNV